MIIVPYSTEVYVSGIKHRFCCLQKLPEQVMQGFEPFIELVDVNDATGDRKSLYDDLERVRGKGRVSNLFRPTEPSQNWDR